MVYVPAGVYCLTVNVKVPDPPLKVHAVGFETGAPVIVQLLSLPSKPERLTVTSVPGIPLEGSKLADGVEVACVTVGINRVNARMSIGIR